MDLDQPLAVSPDGVQQGMGRRGKGDVSEHNEEDPADELSSVLFECRLDLSLQDGEAGVDSGKASVHGGDGDELSVVEGHVDGCGDSERGVRFQVGFLYQEFDRSSVHKRRSSVRGAVGARGESLRLSWMAWNGVI